MIQFIKQTLHVLKSPCREHAELFSRALDERLPAGTRFGLRVHILYCTCCRAYRASLLELREAARAIVPELDSSRTMPAGVRERVRSSIVGDAKENN